MLRRWAFLPARRSFDFLPLFTDEEDIETSVWSSKETPQQWFVRDTDRFEIAVKPTTWLSFDFYP